MADALERVRAVRGEADVRELIVLGADVALREAADEERTRERHERAKESLIRRIGTGEGIDVEALEEVRRSGFSRPL